MKRNLCVLITVMLVLMVFLPVSVFSETYRLGGTDMSIDLDDSLWYVFTRDNIENNAELEELGISYDSIYDVLYNNEAYMDAVLFYIDGDYIQLFVRKRAIEDGIVNLSNYSDEEVLEFAEERAKGQKAEAYSVYKSQYKFAKVEYIDAKLGYYVCEFVTFVNKDIYVMTFQAPSPFDDSEYEEIERMIDSIQFDVDTSLKEPKREALWQRVLTGTIRGAVIGGITGAVIAIVNKNKKNKNKQDSQADDTVEAE